MSARIATASRTLPRTAVLILPTLYRSAYQRIARVSHVGIRRLVGAPAQARKPSYREKSAARLTNASETFGLMMSK